MIDDVAAVHHALAELDAAFAGRDCSAILGLCTEDVVFIGSGEGEEAVGRDRIAEVFAELAPDEDGVKFSLSWHSVDVEVLGDVAILVAWGTGTLDSPRRNAEMRYRLTGVLTRRGERWLWRVYHGSEPARW
ncbi:MAG: nuclear transport factor 2 family protein [Actinomycetota bacterium]|nr:nuclear transport factor 2 family protein [Actinomycetota bacterium]